MPRQVATNATGKSGDMACDLEEIGLDTNLPAELVCISFVAIGVEVPAWCISPNHVSNPAMPVIYPVTNYVKLPTIQVRCNGS